MPKLEKDRESIERQIFYLANSMADTLDVNAQRHIKEGFLRRLKMLQTSMDFFGQIANPSRNKPLDFEECFNLNIHLNSFYVQMRGAMDNLAWALHYQYHLFGEADENDNEARRKCQLLTKSFCDLLLTKKPRLAEELEEHIEWAKEFRLLRDPVAHRIPLYAARAVADPEEELEIKKLYERVICGGVNKGMDLGDFVDAMDKANNAGHYEPIFVMSEPEGLVLKPIHPQTSADYDVILGISNKVLTAIVEN